MHDLILRQHASADFPALCAMDRACFPRGIAYSSAMMRDLLGAPNSDCLVAEAAGSICGFIITLAEDRLGHIITLDVLPQYRRAKIGSSLLHAAHARLAARGIRSISLEAAVDNAPAVAFWRNHGYCEERILKDYYRKGQHAWLMAMRIPPEKEG